ncbi:hypothetical protein JTE90_016654 [Oedothorax gibbosus]|uniref:Uncharacterized protein n=1 Tax=Oedothorax gibbosus TaxID=931172 RepID=A0AAV6V659_9ARAC|nr:hypothetical protein JTE90_016654 [Oedothorax gibbosus]
MPISNVFHTTLPPYRTAVSVRVNRRATGESSVVILPRAVYDRTCEGIGLDKPWEAVAYETQTPRGKFFFVLEPGSVVEAGA